MATEALEPLTLHEIANALWDDGNVREYYALRCYILERDKFIQTIRNASLVTDDFGNLVSV